MVKTIKKIRTWILNTTTSKRAFYEGGKKTQANRDFWNATSPFEDTAIEDRDTLRARARWLFANNPIMANIDGAIVDNVIGQGIQLQSKLGKKKLDDEIERRFNLWAKNKLACDSAGKLNFNDIQRVLLATRMVDGEVFIYKRYTDKGLKLQIIEADALDTGTDNGIVKNAEGIITGYRFKVADSDGRYTNKTVTIPAEFIINYYKSDRFTQERGISEYKQAIIDIKNFSAYQSSTIQGARARASIAYTVKADIDPQKAGVTGDSTDERLQEINGLMVYYLRAGESIDKQAPQGASDDYKAFTENTIRLMATARRVSYELAFKDYSKVNFASSRASLIQDNYRFDSEQSHFISYVLNDIYMTWLEIEILRGNIKIPLAKFKADPDEYNKVRWIKPKRAWVDPLKDLLATEKEIALNLTTQTDEAMAQGKDFEEIVKQKAREIEILKENGLYVEPEPTKEEGSSPTQEIADARAIIEELVQRIDVLESK